MSSLHKGLALAGLAVTVAALWGLTGWWFPEETGIFTVYPLRVACINTVLTCAGIALAYITLGVPTSAWRVRTARVAVLVTALTLCVVLFELPVLFGFVDYRKVFPSPWRLIDRDLQLDPELIWIHKPHSRFTGRIPGGLVYFFGIETDRLYDIDLRYDANGFRNDIDLDRADIVVIGDSFAESSWVALADIVPTRMANALGVKILNLGHNGYGPQQELIVLKRYGLPVRPKVVVWMLYEGNDLDDYTKYHEAITGVNQDLQVRHQLHPSLWDRTFCRNLLLAAAQPLRSSKPTTGALHQGALSSGELITAGEGAGEKMYFFFRSSPLSDQEGVAFEGTKETVRNAFQICQENGINFVLVFVPTKWRVYHELIRLPPETGLKPEQLNDLPEQVKTWCSSVLIPLLDLTPSLTLQAKRQKRARPFWESGF